LKRVLIHPRDVQAAREPHHSTRAIRLALLAIGLVFLRIPHLGGPSTLGIDRQIIDVSFWRCKHAISPVVCDQGYPITGDVVWSRRPRSRNSCALSLSTALSAQVQRSERQQHCNEKSSAHNLPF